MKKLSFIDKIIFIFNSLATVWLLGSFIIPFISPKQIATISVFSLGMPLAIIINILFILYWLLKLKRQFLVSLSVLLIGFNYLSSFIQFTEKKVFLNDDLKIMSYNVRMLNIFEWTDEPDIESKIHEFIKEKSPDVLSIQEYHRKSKKIKGYKYQYTKHHNNSQIGLAILSKYKIINKGSLDFKNSGNNAVFADIVIKKDTVRFYNIHLQSLKINKNKENFGAKDAKNLLSIFKTHFVGQANQVEKLLAHESKCSYKTIFMGDFNNTAFSWVYKQLKTEKKDAFVEAGSGLGKSFDYIFPFKIDHILVDNDIAVHNFKTFALPYSDHYPLLARINLNSQQ